MGQRLGVVSCLAWAFWLSLAAAPSFAQQAPPVAGEPSGRLFAVEITTGAAWDPAKPAHEQAFFREHSAHLRKLREQGGVVLGARYSDKGFIVLRAASAEEARATMEQDASIRNATFRYELHDFNVFYGGAVQPAPRPAPPPR